MGVARDYYQILGVDRDADPQEIKRAFRRLAMKYHPDRAQGDPDAEELFKQASEAYAVLGDPERRAKYDRVGVGLKDGPKFDPSIISDLFGEKFSEIFGGRRRKKARRGRDTRYDVRITLTEAARGTEKELRIPRRVVCSTCHGSGARPGSDLKVCQKCQGSGRIRLSRGPLSLDRPCPYCHGEGRIVTDPCRRCYGTGLMETTQVLSVRIPAGVTDGQKLRVAGKGEEGVNGGKPGDLYVKVSILPHPILTMREGGDLHCRVPISPAEAALGCRVPVPTLDGETTLSIPPGTQPGTVFRMAGEGFKPLGAKAPGDQLVEIVVEIPTTLDHDTRRLYRALTHKDHELPERRRYHDTMAALRTDSR